MRVRVRETILKFRRPFITSAWSLHFRKVLLLELVDTETGAHAWGEASPLPGFGTETYDAASAALHDAATQLHRVPAMDIDADSVVASVPSLSSAPCARFAVECACLDLQAQREARPLAQILAPQHYTMRVLVNTTLSMGPPAACAEAARVLAQDGFSCIKLKVGATDLATDLATIGAVRDAVGPDFVLRADANGAWNEAQALRALESLQAFNLQYVEQPVPPDATGTLARVARRSPVPVAADESVLSLNAARELLAAGELHVFILKPMALGALRACRDFAAEAAHTGATVVFTSLLDSAVGRRAVAHAAASVAAASMLHHGLATGTLFETDTAPDCVVDGGLTLPQLAGLGLALSESESSIVRDTGSGATPQ